jgi:aspartate ammonia-lyase
MAKLVMYFKNKINGVNIMSAIVYRARPAAGSNELQTKRENLKQKVDAGVDLIVKDIRENLPKCLDFCGKNVTTCVANVVKLVPFVGKCVDVAEKAATACLTADVTKKSLQSCVEKSAGLSKKCIKKVIDAKSMDTCLRKYC